MAMVLLTILACDIPITPVEPTDTPTSPEVEFPVSSVGCEVTAVPQDVRSKNRLSSFYHKYADANGIPVVSSEKVDDEALERACGVVTDMLSIRDDAKRELQRAGMFLAIIAKEELTTDIPEYSHLPSYYNVRARGLGSLPTSCAEESILCDRSDRWYGENICIHEFSHAIMGWGLEKIDPEFNRKLNAAYSEARSSGNFANTYAISSKAEFWAENVQNWYNTNLETPNGRPNGVHNGINTREELRQAAPLMYELLSENFPENPTLDDCYQNSPY